MVEHAENFLALYAIDMDAALEIQSPESWDSFPLFQLLNDFLRTDCKFMQLAHLYVSATFRYFHLKKKKSMISFCNTLFPPLIDHLCNGKFHKHLQDLYAPLVVRYVDLMESSIAQSIHKGFERESWEPVK